MEYLTTRQLIQRIEELGFSAYRETDVVIIRRTPTSGIISRVRTNREYQIDTDKAEMDLLEHNKKEQLYSTKEQLYNILDIYARTPLEEREEKYSVQPIVFSEDKYYLVLDEISNETHNFIQYLNADKYVQKLFIGSHYESGLDKTKFTDYEIKKLRKKFPKIVGIATKVKVEEDE